MTTFDVAGPLHEAIAATRAEARRRGLRLTVSAPARALWAAGDAAACAAALTGRLARALADLPDGAALRVDVHADADSVRIAIGATGPCIAWPATARPASPDAIATRLAGTRVLVADDSADAARLLAVLLRRAGAEVRAVFDGQSAIDEALRARPDAVVLDLDMPRVDGCAVARRIRAHAVPAPRLVALTGSNADDDRRRSAAAGFDHHLCKPVDVPALLALLAS